MEGSLKEQLIKRLSDDGHKNISDALKENLTEHLVNDEKNILIKYSNHIKNGESFIQVNGGIAGFSPASGGSGFLSGARDGFGNSENQD